VKNPTHALVTTRFHALFYLKTSKFGKNLTILPESVNTHWCGMHIRMRSPLTESINPIITKLVESGITEKIVKQHETVKQNEKIAEKPLKAVGLGELLMFFKVWLICVHLCLFCFFGELLWRKLQFDYVLIAQKLRIKKRKIKNEVKEEYEIEEWSDDFKCVSVDLN
jgi:hypothetical protein